MHLHILKTYAPFCESRKLCKQPMITGDASERVLLLQPHPSRPRDLRVVK